MNATEVYPVTEQSSIQYFNRVPGIEPTTLTFLQELDAKGGKPIFEMQIEDARNELRNVQSGYAAKLPASVEDRTIPVGPKGSVTVRIVRPRGNKHVLPAVMYFHGGGWALGDKDTYDRLIREIAHGAGAAVVFVEYSRSPEAKFPVAIEEAYAATKWTVDSAPSINVDPARLAVCGDGSGGTMATVVALLAKERREPQIGFQLLFTPATDAGFDTLSYHTYAEGYYVTRSEMEWFWNNYLPDLSVSKDPAASPLQATTEELKALPPALIITAEHDPLRDEGEAYGRKLMEAGVRVTTTRYLGTIHDFVVLNALMGTPAARGAIAQANNALRRVFGAEKLARAA